MSPSNIGPKRSEKGLLTPDNCVVALIDHQPQMLFGVSNFDRQEIINNVIALAKAARVFELPVVLSAVETKSFSGNMWPQLRAVFPGQEPIERSSMNSWDDKNFVAAIEKTGRKKIGAGRALDGNLRYASDGASNSRWVRGLCRGGLLRRCEPTRSRQRDETGGPSRREARHGANGDVGVATRLGKPRDLRRGDGYCEESFWGLRHGGGVRLHHGARSPAHQVPGIQGSSCRGGAQVTNRGSGAGSIPVPALIFQKY